MKIVAIGGGNNSNIKKNGNPQIYEHENIDKEIIRLTNKKYPNLLYISHASSDEYEKNSFKKIENTYGSMYHCPVKLFSSDMLGDFNTCDELLEWADIIYVGGGNTDRLMELWSKSGVSDKLIELVNKNKVFCGTSAGGGCWFKYTWSDYLQEKTGNPNSPYMEVKGLGLVDLIFNPHAGNTRRMRSVGNITQQLNTNCLSLTDNMAIEIVDDEYKLIEGYSSEGYAKEAIISYWEDGDYHIEPVKDVGLIDELVNSRKKGRCLRK